MNNSKPQHRKVADKRMDNMVKSEVKKIIRQLKKREISIFGVPEEYKNDVQLVTFERESGLRITGKRGFDVISNSFFVKETLLYVDIDGQERKKCISLSFDDFNSYFDFLNGDIYDNACYTFCHLPDNIIASRKIDIERLMERKSFIEETIDGYTLLVSNEEKENYENAKKVHKQCQQWIKKFNCCSSYEEFATVVNNYKKSKFASIVDVNFFFFYYIFLDVNDPQRFSVIMEYVFSNEYERNKWRYKNDEDVNPPFFAELINALCSIYNPDDIIKSFKYSPCAKSTIYKKKRPIKEYIHNLKDGKIEFSKNAFFDKKTHFYCDVIRGVSKGIGFSSARIFRYFDTFEAFVDYRKGDLTYCDLSSALECDVDFSKYITDETTKLPVHTYAETNYSVQKYYREGKFYVTQKWFNSSGSVIKEYEHLFEYFFDFVAFLKGNLSEANLLFCDGLEFLEHWKAINFSGAKMRSFLCEKFGLQYDIQEINEGLIESFGVIEQNESDTALVIQSSGELAADAIRQELSTVDLDSYYKCQKIYYISDIHLMHRIRNAECRSKEDVIYVVQKIVNTIGDEAGSPLLIDGDVASDFEIFQLFVKLLAKTLRGHTKVIFILGNHELWSFSGFSIDQIVSKYRAVLNEYGMYLLYNDILYMDSKNGMCLIEYRELSQMNDERISECLRNARYVILGGLGFSGYNMEFNADNGIYRGTLDRTTEIKESKIFEDLYNCLCPVLSKKNTIILTHTPKKDWCREERPDKNFVYVSGHTHKNVFYDDGEYRVYADNQVGYHNDNPHLKTFLIDGDYDCFDHYADGMFEITSNQYSEFYRAKNIFMSFHREVNMLYMLKKNGYYCFIHKSKWGNLTILNGGAMKSLEVPDIQYYYDNMDAMVSTIKAPLDKFMAFLKYIADTIKKIGGSGTVHGCIVDIDFYNHIYVNPIDLTITGYWAEDIINKVAYPSIPALLEEKCPKIFDKYIKFLEGNNENPLALKQQKDRRVSRRRYLDTDIYQASREIKKMQKLSSNILTVWDEGILSKRGRIGHK